MHPFLHFNILLNQKWLSVECHSWTTVGFVFLSQGIFFLSGNLLDSVKCSNFFCESFPRWNYLRSSIFNNLAFYVSLRVNEQWLFKKCFLFPWTPLPHGTRSFRLAAWSHSTGLWSCVLCFVGIVAPWLGWLELLVPEVHLQATLCKTMGSVSRQWTQELPLTRPSTAVKVLLPCMW